MHVESLFKKIINIIIQLNFNENIKNFLEIKINFLKNGVENFGFELRCVALHRDAWYCVTV